MWHCGCQTRPSVRLREPCGHFPLVEGLMDLSLFSIPDDRSKALTVRPKCCVRGSLARVLLLVHLKLLEQVQRHQQKASMGEGDRASMVTNDGRTDSHPGDMGVVFKQNVSPCGMCLASSLLDNS